MAYRLGKELGSGAIGRVVEVHGDDGRAWAGKVLHASQRIDQRARRRFEAEAKLLGGVSHPNLVAIEGLTEIEGETVLLMELVSGSDLNDVIAAEAPLPVERVAAIGRGIAAGLAAAHRAGLVHRDLKPANVLIAADGTPKVADFGLARAASFAASDPDAVVVAGTPDYMAPESTDPLAIDGRSDLYALGCILCELATGSLPFRGATPFALLRAHRVEPIPELAEVAEPVRSTIRKLLAKAPTDRPQSATEVEAMLATTALTVVGETAATTRGTVSDARACASCGAPGLRAIGVCFACGQRQLELSRGRMTVIVTGPGERAHKLDTELRHRLLDWLARNPNVGIDAQRLTKTVPRLPFALVTGVDDSSGRALVTYLHELGLQAEIVSGGPLSHRAIRANGWTLAKRIMLIGAGGSFGFAMGSITKLVFAGSAVLLGSLVAGFRLATRPVGQLAARDQLQLPSAFDAALARVIDIVPAMSASRHRDSLRGVIERALALRDALGESERATTDVEVAKLIDLAALAASRLDQLEAELSPEDLRSDDEAARSRWFVRDRWAATLLQVTGFLDAMRARAVSARAKGAAVHDLDGLRSQIEALEELTA